MSKKSLLWVAACTLIFLPSLGAQESIEIRRVMQRHNQLELLSWIADRQRIERYRPEDLKFLRAQQRIRKIQLKAIELARVSHQLQIELLNNPHQFDVKTSKLLKRCEKLSKQLRKMMVE